MALYEEEQKECEAVIETTLLRDQQNCQALVQCHNGDESYLITWTEVQSHKNGMVHLAALGTRCSNRMATSTFRMLAT